LSQLEIAESINNRRLEIWNTYYEALKTLAEEGKIELPYIPVECVQNAHMFYIKTKDLEERTAFISYLGSKGIKAVFHYVPLHTAKAGKKYGEFVGEDKWTTRESERLVRLPMFYGLKDEEIHYVIDVVKEFYI